MVVVRIRRKRSGIGDREFGRRCLSYAESEYGIGMLESHAPMIKAPASRSILTTDASWLGLCPS